MSGTGASLWREGIFAFRRNVSRVLLGKDWGRLLQVSQPALAYSVKVGLDIAIEALKEGRRLKKASIDELSAAAKQTLPLSA
jgi:hypothetical protein